jgi:hypothetical protein
LMPSVTPEQLAAAYNEADEAVADVWAKIKALLEAFEVCEEKRKAKNALKAQKDNEMGLKD